MRNSQVLHARLTEHVTPYGSFLQGQPDTGSTMGLLALDSRINQQAAMLAYINDFKLMLVLAFACIPLAFLFRKVTIAERMAAHAE